MSAASKKALEDLHAKVATTLADALDEAAGAEEKKGLAALLNVARQFLKDNNIEAAAVPGSPTGQLAEQVTKYPFNPAEDGVRH